MWRAQIVRSHRGNQTGRSPSTDSIEQKNVFWWCGEICVRVPYGAGKFPSCSCGRKATATQYRRHNNVTIKKIKNESQQSISKIMPWRIDSFEVWCGKKMRNMKMTVILQCTRWMSCVESFSQWHEFHFDLLSSVSECACRYAVAIAAVCPRRLISHAIQCVESILRLCKRFVLKPTQPVDRWIARNIQKLKINTTINHSR